MKTKERPRQFLLEKDGRTPKAVDLMTWARGAERRKWDVVKDNVGGVLISTVFLGLDHSYSGVGPPVLWETMVFGGELDEEQERYTSYDAAVAGHKEMVARVKMEGK